MRLVSYPEDASPTELREAAEHADENAEEARGQVIFWERLAQDLRVKANELERGNDG